jgi:hypothetical protein
VRIYCYYKIFVFIESAARVKIVLSISVIRISVINSNNKLFNSFMAIISNYSVSSRGAIDTNYPPARDAAAQDSSVSAGAETRTPTNKSSALSVLIARSQTPKLSADTSVQSNNPSLKSSTDFPIPVDFINSHTDLLDDAIARAVRERGGNPCAYRAFARDDIFKMVDKIQKDTNKPMSEADIIDLMKNYNNTVDVNDIGQGVDGKMQKDIVDHFERQMNPPSDIDMAKEIAKEIGLDPSVLVDAVEKSPNRPLSEDQIKLLAEHIKYGW